MLEVRELVKYYWHGDVGRVCAVDHVSLRIDRGELVALYGPSGSGKLTLVQLIAGVIAPDSGEVIVDGREITGMSAEQIATYRHRELGYVDQAFDALAGATVAENAARKLWLSDPLGAERAVAPLLARVGLGEHAHRRPAELVADQRQLMLIARALSNEPKLVLADQPTIGLDVHGSRAVLELLAELCRELEASALLVTHDPQATQFADRAYTLEAGRLTILAADELIARRRDRPSASSGPATDA